MGWNEPIPVTLIFREENPREVMKSTILAFLPCIALALVSCTAPRPIDYRVLDNIDECEFSLGGLTRGDTTYADNAVWNCDSTYPGWTAPLGRYVLMVDSGNGFVMSTTELWIVASRAEFEMSHARLYEVSYRLCIDGSCLHQLDARDLTVFDDDLENTRSFIHRLATWIEDHYLEPGQSRSIDAKRAGFYLSDTFVGNIAMIFGDPGYLRLPERIPVR